MVVIYYLVCSGYKMRMTPWRCVENQLSPMLMPDFPCHTCTQAVGVGVNEASRPAAPPRGRVKWPEHLKNASAAVKRAYLEGSKGRGKIVKPTPTRIGNSG